PRLLDTRPISRRRIHRTVTQRDRIRPGAVLVADVQACYQSIRPGAVGRRLRALGCDRAEIEAVIRSLESFAEDGVPGLPVGPDPSAVLANAVLSVADAELAAESVGHCRWVDDILAFAPNPRTAHRAKARLAETLG